MSSLDGRSYCVLSVARWVLYGNGSLGGLCHILPLVVCVSRSFCYACDASASQHARIEESLS